jgi:PilZ domain
MSTDQVSFERRATQRFDFQIPVTIRSADKQTESSGFTQDLSARGALLYTDLAVSEGDAVELTLSMPSEITLTENMRVRCRGRVMRVCTALTGTKFGVAVHLEGYEYLPEIESANATFMRDSAVSDDRTEENEMTAHTFQMRSDLTH